MKVTGAGLFAMDIHPVVIQTVTAIRERVARAPEGKPPTLRNRHEAGDADRHASSSGRRQHGDHHRRDWLAGPKCARLYIGGVGQEAGSDHYVGKGSRQRAGVSAQPGGNLMPSFMIMIMITLAETDSRATTVDLDSQRSSCWSWCWGAARPSCMALRS